MTLKSIDKIHGNDGLPLGVFSVSDCIPDDILNEHLPDTTDLLVDESRNPLNNSTSRQTADGGLGEALNVVSQLLTVTFGASLSESLSSFASTCRVAGY